MDSALAYARFLSGHAVTAREGAGLTAPQKTTASPGKSNKGEPNFSALGSGIAPSGDIGFVYGHVSLRKKKEVYLRIWRCEPKGWKIALQMLRL